MMFDDKTFEQMRSESGGETEILALFREWVVARRAVAAYVGDDDAEFNTLIFKANEIRDSVLAIPAAGMQGFAVKAYLCCHCQLDDEGAHELAELPDFYSIDEIYETQRTMQAFVRELPRFAPELAPFCEPFLAEREEEEEEEQPAGDDAALLAASLELANLREREAAVYRAHPNMNVEDEQRLVLNVFEQPRDCLETKIAATPPTTLAGAAVKLRRLFETEIAEVMSDIDVDLLRQVLALIEREAQS